MAEKDLRNKYFQSYLLGCVNDFENGWVVYEKKLKKYMMSYTKFNEWTQVKVADPNDPGLAARIQSWNSRTRS